MAASRGVHLTFFEPFDRPVPLHSSSWTHGDVDTGNAVGVASAMPRPSGDVLRELLAIDTISPASRAVLILHFAEGLSVPEVAAILDISLGTAKSRLGYGLNSIRKHLKASGGSHD